MDWPDDQALTRRFAHRWKQNKTRQGTVNGGNIYEVMTAILPINSSMARNAMTIAADPRLKPQPEQLPIKTGDVS